MCRAAASVCGRCLDAVGRDAAAHLLQLKALALAEAKQEGGEHAYIRNLLSWATVCGGYMFLHADTSCSDLPNLRGMVHMYRSVLILHGGQMILVHAPGTAPSTPDHDASCSDHAVAAR